MFTSEFNERSRSNPLCDFRLGTVASSDHETPLTLFCLLFSLLFFVSRTPVICPVFSLRDCVSVCASVLSQCRLTSVDTRLRDTAVWAGSRLWEQGQEFQASSTCVIASCCLVCSVLYARYTDAFNDSPRFTIRHEHKWYSVLVYVTSIQKVVVVIALNTSRPGEVLCFVCLSGDQY